MLLALELELEETHILMRMKPGLKAGEVGKINKQNHKRKP